MSPAFSHCFFKRLRALSNDSLSLSFKPGRTDSSPYDNIHTPETYAAHPRALRKARNLAKSGGDSRASSPGGAVRKTTYISSTYLA